MAGRDPEVGGPGVRHHLELLRGCPQLDLQIHPSVNFSERIHPSINLNERIHPKITF